MMARRILAGAIAAVALALWADIIRPAPYRYASQPAPRSPRR